MIGLVTAVRQLLNLDTGPTQSLGDVFFGLRGFLSLLEDAPTASTGIAGRSAIDYVRGIRMRSEALEDLSQQQKTATATTRDLAEEFRKLQAESQARLGFQNIVAARETELVNIQTSQTCLLYTSPSPRD